MASLIVLAGFYLATFGHKCSLYAAASGVIPLFRKVQVQLLLYPLDCII